MFDWLNSLSSTLQPLHYCWVALKDAEEFLVFKKLIFNVFWCQKTDRHLCTYGKGRKAGLFLGKKGFFHFLPSSMSVDINFKRGWHSTVRRVKDLVLSSQKVSNRCSSNFKATLPSHLVPKRMMAFLAAQSLPYQMQQTTRSQSLTALFQSDPYFILCFRGRSKASIMHPKHNHMEKS